MDLGRAGANVSRLELCMASLADLAGLTGASWCHCHDGDSTCHAVSSHVTTPMCRQRLSNREDKSVSRKTPQFQVAPSRTCERRGFEVGEAEPWTNPTWKHAESYGNDLQTKPC